MRKIVGLVVALVVLLGGALVADRVARSRAEAVAEQRVRERVDVQGDLVVGLDGFPFLTQLARGRLDRVTGSADQATFGSLSLTDVEVEATGVSTRSPASAESTDLEATVSAATLQAAARERSGLDLTVTVESGEIVVSGQALGLTLSASATPRVDDGALFVDLGSVQVGGLDVDVDSLPAALRNRLTDLEVPVDELPDGLVLRSATVVADGVRVSATGTDVTW